AAQAATVRNQAALEKADVDFKRSMSLFNKGLLSESDRKSAETSYSMAKAALEGSQFDAQRAEGALHQMRDSLSKTTIYSPMEGSVSSLQSRVGERVVGTMQFAGTEVMRIANLGAMEARVNVNENDIVNVKVGDGARINV